MVKSERDGIAAERPLTVDLASYRRDNSLNCPARSAEFLEPNQSDPTGPASSEKTFRCRRRANHRYPFGHPPRQEGRIAIVTDAGWMRWTQRRRARWWSQGGVSRERSSVAQTTGASRAFARISVGTSPIGVLTRGCCVRRSRVVLASVADVKPAETRRPDRASGKSQSAGDGDKRNSSPGRARSKP